jgi:hypothetical protein
MKEKSPPTKLIRVGLKEHTLAKTRAAKLGMKMQEVAEIALRNGLPTENPKKCSAS